MLAASAAARALLDSISAALSDADRVALRLAFEAEAFPERCRDVRSHVPLFNRALGLATLDDARRETIRALRVAFDERRLREFVGLLDRYRLAPIDDEQSNHVMARAREFRLRFVRSEIDARAVAALRRVLTDDERAKIRGLDEYERLCVRTGDRWWED